MQAPQPASLQVGLSLLSRALNAKYGLKEKITKHRTSKLAQLVARGLKVLSSAWSCQSSRVDCSMPPGKTTASNSAYAT